MNDYKRMKCLGSLKGTLHPICRGHGIVEITREAPLPERSLLLPEAQSTLCFYDLLVCSTARVCTCLFIPTGLSADWRWQCLAHLCTINATWRTHHEPGASTLDWSKRWAQAQICHSLALGPSGKEGIFGPIPSFCCGRRQAVRKRRKTGSKVQCQKGRGLQLILGNFQCKNQPNWSTDIYS